MQDAEKRLMDALYPLLIDALPEDWDIRNIARAVLRACHESDTKVVDDDKRVRLEHEWQAMQNKVAAIFEQAEKDFDLDEEGERLAREISTLTPEALLRPFTI